MKYLLTVTIFCLVTFAHAETSAFFKPDNSSVTLSVQGMDTDAKTLYDALNASVVDESNVLTKTVLLTRLQVPILELICNTSKLGINSSCSLKLFSNNITAISKEDRSTKFEVIDSYAAPRIANFFLSSNDGGLQKMIFKSLNGKLKIWKTLSTYGQVNSFVLEYND